jgi:hypothetical protein
MSDRCSIIYETANQEVHMSDLARSTYVHESSRTANQEAAFARAAATRANIAANKAKSEAINAANRAQAARSSDRSALAEMKIRLEKSEAQLAQMEAQIAEKSRLIAERDSIIKDWMHSNETFKVLARKYGRKLGMTDDERLGDYREEIFNQAEQNPEFQDTDLGKEVKRKMGLTGA